MTEGIDLVIFGVMTAIFVVITLLLGWFGYKNTKNNDEFLLGRNKTSPLIIALSYGATFLSASAVIGFGGQAAVHGMSLMWLCFLNLFAGLIVAFIIFGRRTRRIGRKLGAATFADFLGKVYKSSGIRVFTAVLILIMMPIYAAAVLKGGVNSLAVITGLDYNLILIALSLIVAVYVVYGGIIAVMYNDAFQAFIMFAGMVVILLVTWSVLGGVTAANEGLVDLWNHPVWETISEIGVADGFNGWTSVSEFGSREWMTVVTTFIMGVGIGALTQPQLVVRYMSAKSDRDLDKSLLIGSVFIMVVVGAAYTIGPLTNVFFNNEYGMTSFQYISSLGLGTDFIIPQYILEVFKGITFGEVFISLFLLSLICASISTISALMHTIGVAGGYDLYSVIKRKGTNNTDAQSLSLNRAFIVVFMLLVVVYCYFMPKEIIAKATSVFMGVTAAALLPAYFHSLYSKNPNRSAAVASIAVGSIAYMFSALFLNAGTSIFLPICSMITGNNVLFPGTTIAFLDPLIIALPLSIIAMIVTILVKKRQLNTMKTCTGIDSHD
ncbi:transporter solute:sodium symporter family [methanogenic archaeon mixed culture ISO4-G1]|nr:transporter solute:sodium symporter family [methanogenic archaeon mixed culture ISO4-G1]